MRSPRSLTALAAAMVTWLLAAWWDPASAWTAAEHQALADSALAVALSGWPAGDALSLRAAEPARGPGSASFVTTLGFGALCAWSARNDGARAGCHERACTVLQQLKRLPAARIDSLARDALRGDSLLFAADARRAQARLRRLESRNVVASYLQHHLVALRLARAAGAGPGSHPERLRRALIYEAIAQSYLADAFAAGHIMTPAGAARRLATLNLRHARDHFDNLGAYVLNARGETWQTFGDQLLFWYGPSFAHVFEASVVSLRELLLCYATARDGPLPGPLRAWADSVAGAQHSSPAKLAAAWIRSGEGAEYLADVRLPSLMLIPTPMVATWSVRTAEKDEHGLRRRRHYPQLAEPGGHDPTLDAQDIKRLPSRAAVPAWLIPDALFRADPASLIRDHPDFASVRFAQAANPPPSYAGFLFIAGTVLYGNPDGGGSDRVLGIGYSPVGESPVLFDRVSVDVLFLNPDGADRPRSLVVRVGGSLALPGFGVWRRRSLRWLNRLRIEAGPAWTRGGPSGIGDHFAVAIESPTIPLGIAYLCATLRAGYHRTDLDRPRDGVAVEMVLQ